jgi:SCY1-like protein 2
MACVKFNLLSFLIHVQMATLSVHEAMGFKVDREAVATLVLPQLWAMSMGPCRLLLFISPGWRVLIVTLP